MNEKQFIKNIKKLIDTFIANWIYLIDEYEKEIEKDLDNEVNSSEDNMAKEFYDEPCKIEITD